MAGAGGGGRLTPARPAARAWPVMGTMFEITVWDPDSARARLGLAAARAAVVRVDSLMSTYRAESELSAVNRRAGTDSVTRLSPETVAVLAAALDYARASGGALDVTVGPLVHAWGFDSRDPAVPPATTLDSARTLVGWQRVDFDRARSTVRLPVRGMRLDFGAIAKGFALDLAVAALRDAGIRRATVDLGGNLRFLGPPDDAGREVAIRDPRNPADLLAVVEVRGGAVATSGDYERFFVHDGVRYSHIIDPRTGWPARDIEGVSVFAATGMASDALSTALFVVGVSRGCAVAREAGVEALWVLDRDQDTERIVVTPGLRYRVRLLRGRTELTSCTPSAGSGGWRHEGLK